MTKTELLELIQNGENSFVEFKRDHDIGHRDLAKELVALGNADGGHVLLGVEDDQTISGIQRENLEEWVMTACRVKIRPPIIPTYERIKNVSEGRDVAVVSVSQGWTVHHVLHSGHRTYYVRVGSQSREADWEELQRLAQRRGSLRFETQPVTGSTMDDLDYGRLADYFGRVRGQAAPETTDTEGWRDLLYNTEMLVDSPTEGTACSVAGLLLFGKNPQRFLPHACIDVTFFQGTEKDYDATPRSIRGPLVSLWRDRGDSVEIVEPGLIDQTIERLAAELSTENAPQGSGVREQVWVYPREAMREAVVNAVVHRDYLLSSTSIEVSVYADRIEFVSPGNPPNGITADRMRTGCRAARNAFLKDILRDYRYMEHMGMGIPRKIIRLVREHNGTEPELVVGEEQFSVVLRRARE